MWKNKIYSFFIPQYEDMYDMLENCYNIHVDTKCFATDMKTLSPKYKKYNLHHKVRIYEGYQQIRESKVGLLIQQYEIFEMNND